MKIPSALPITADQSRAARFRLGLSQANIIEESGLPAHKLKQFETGRFLPDLPFLEALRAFYIAKGVDFEEAEGTEKNTKHLVKQQPPAGSAMVQPASRMCFYISDQIAPEAVNEILGRMDANDERIAAILESPVNGGFLSQYDEETETKQRELFGAMAENYLGFRLLQGRNIVGPKPKSEPLTHADLLASFFSSSPLASVALAGEKETAPATSNVDEEEQQ